MTELIPVERAETAFLPGPRRHEEPDQRDVHERAVPQKGPRHGGPRERDRQDHDRRRGARTGRVARHARTADPRPRRPASLSLRPAERRWWAGDLTGPAATGLVLYGMGGIGKSVLAAQIAARVRRLQSGRPVITFRGELAVTALEAAVGRPAAQPSAPAETAGAAAAMQSLLVLDDFDDNLTDKSGELAVRDPELAAYLSGWTGKLLITSRKPFTLPERHAAGRPRQSPRLVFRPLGPLTSSGSAELANSLPAMRLLRDDERDEAWRLTAGHPLVMEYLDSLLAAGERFPDLASRVLTLVAARTGEPLPAIEPTELPAPVAEGIACAAGDVLVGELYDRLSAGARHLLERASAAPGPATPEALSGRPGPIAEGEAAGLLQIGLGRELSVHRWTADRLSNRLLEAGPRQQAPHGRALSRRMLRIGAAGAATAAVVALAVTAAETMVVPHLAAADSPSGSLAAQAGRATMARDQAASWVARQVGSAAILACDPAMCAALVQHGVPGGNLLVLGPGASDPLGSNLVLATPAVRAMFGGRLASVYAPEILASFGTGPTGIEVRLVAPDGAAAYRSALAADVRARQLAAAQLLRGGRLTLTPAARAALAAGRVDDRILITLATIAASEPVHVQAFGDAGPGASPGMPLRSVQIVAPAATARDMLAFVRAQRSPYLPAHAGLIQGPGGATTLTVEFSAPAPLGLLAGQVQSQNI